MAINIFPRVDVTGTNRWSQLRKGHWSTRGLVLCDTFGQGVPASRVPTTRIGTYAAAVSASPHGINFPALTDNIQMGNTAFLPLARATVLCVRQCADTTLREGILFGTTQSTTTNRFLLHLPYSDGNIYWDFGGSGNPGGRLSVAFSKTTQREAWAVVAGQNGSAIWRNGERLATQTTPCTARTFTNSFFFKINGSDGDVQQISFFAVLDAEWCPAQIQEWAANPWLMFATNRLDVPGSAPPPAAGARAFATFFG